MGESWVCRELAADELGGVLALIAEAPLHARLHLRDAAADPAGAGRWWFAAIGTGGVGAFAAVEGTRACLYGDDEAAVEALARAMLKSQQLHTSRETHRHVLFGPRHVVDPFWQIFRAVDRQVVADRHLALMVGDGEGKGSKRLELALAMPGDLSLCVAFLGDHASETQGRDPRKTAPTAFEREIATAIEARRLLIGREGGRAMFVADAVPLDDGIVMLQRVAVPLHYRSRKILVGGALHAARSIGPGAGNAVWLLADGEMLEVAAARAGYRRLSSWREVAMLG